MLAERTRRPWSTAAALLLLPALLALPPAAPATAVEAPASDASWPLPGRPAVVRPFQPPPEPWLRGHRGVDLQAAAGDPVLAPIEGVVVFAGTVVDRGVVVVARGPLRVSLEPVRADVRPGAAVSAGDPLGVVAAEPGHCPPRQCLHWGLRVHGGYRDPLLLVLRLRPVLLPISTPGRR
jgi:murein DD-endopeptidase MepM/ murein hydrolase activator NlpD